MSPSNVTLKIDIHDKNGKKIIENDNFLEIDTNEKQLSKINLNEIVSSSKYANDVLCAHVIGNFKNNKIPSRIKFGLNVGNNESNFLVTYVSICEWVIL